MEGLAEISDVSTLVVQDFSPRHWDSPPTRPGRPDEARRFVPQASPVPGFGGFGRFGPPKGRALPVEGAKMVFQGGRGAPKRPPVASVVT